MSLYAEYLREKTSDQIIESDKGFITYRFYYDQKDNCEAVYIIDLYVRPEFRKSHVASDAADIVVRIAKKRGCKKLLGSVVPSNKDCTSSVKVLLAYGMSIESATENMIWFKKDIGGVPSEL